MFHLNSLVNKTTLFFSHSIITLTKTIKKILTNSFNFKFDLIYLKSFEKSNHLMIRKKDKVIDNYRKFI